MSVIASILNSTDNFLEELKKNDPIKKRLEEISKMPSSDKKVTEVTKEETINETTENKASEEKAEAVEESEERKENPEMVNPIVVEEPTGKVKLDFSKMTQSNATMKPVKNATEDLFKGEAFDKLPVLERIKVVLESNGIACNINSDPSGLFKVDMFIKDAFFGTIYVDRDGCLFNSIPKIALSINPDITKLEDAPMLALFNSNWPKILIDFTNGESVSACDCITSQERELNELFDLATMPAKIKDSHRAKTLKNLEMIKMEGILNDILAAEKKTRFRIANFKDSGTFELISDDQVRESLLATYSAKKPYKVTVDLTKGGDDRFVKVAL